MTISDAKVSPLHLRVFLASPSDVSQERKLAQEILEDLVCTQAFRGLVTVEVFRYDDERARIGLPLNVTPQQGITRAGFRPADCDFTVAFLWSRLGTPLPASEVHADGRQYASGTEWEIEDALSAGKEVYLYVRTEEPGFLQAPVADGSAREEDAAQYARLRAFLGRFGPAGGAQTGAILRYANPNELRETFAQNMAGVLRRRLDLAKHRRDRRHLQRVGALSLAAAILLSAGWCVLDRGWIDRPEVSIDQVEDCDIVPTDNNAYLIFSFSYRVARQLVGDATYVEVAENRSFAPLLYSIKQDEFSAQKMRFQKEWPKQHAWNGWLRVTVRDGQQRLRGTSPVVPLDCKEGGN